MSLRTCNCLMRCSVHSLSPEKTYWNMQKQHTVCSILYTGFTPTVLSLRRRQTLSGHEASEGRMQQTAYSMKGKESSR